VVSFRIGAWRADKGVSPSGEGLSPCGELGGVEKYHSYPATMSHAAMPGGAARTGDHGRCSKTLRGARDPEISAATLQQALEKASTDEKLPYVFRVPGPQGVAGTETELKLIAVTA